MYSKTKIIIAIMILIVAIIFMCVKVNKDINHSATVSRVIESVDIHGNSNPGNVATRRCEIALNRFSRILMTDDEYELLASVIYDLAGGKSECEQRRVCEIVFNRVLSDNYPDTVAKVINDMSPCPQFDLTNGECTDYQRGIIDYVLRAEPLTESDYYFY